MTVSRFSEDNIASKSLTNHDKCMLWIKCVSLHSWINLYIIIHNLIYILNKVVVEVKFTKVKSAIVNML